MVITDRLSRVLELPLYQEAWFVARLRKGVRADREHLAEAVRASSELSVILERFYPRERARLPFICAFLGAEAERRRGDFLRKLADGIEAASGGRLQKLPGSLPCAADSAGETGSKFWVVCEDHGDER